MSFFGTNSGRGKTVPKERYRVPDAPPFGIRQKRTTTGIRVLYIDFVADPAKRRPSWIKDAAKAFPDPRQVQIEFYNNWETSNGKPVFPEYSAERHYAKEEVTVIRGLPVYVGWDYGMSPAAIFEQVDTRGQVRVLRTLAENNKSLTVFGPMVIRQMLELNAEAGYPKHTWQSIEARARVLEPLVLAALLHGQGDTSETMLDWTPAQKARVAALRGAIQEAFADGLDFQHHGDPAGSRRQSNDAKSGSGLLKNLFGLTVESNELHQNWETRRNAVSGLLTAMDVAPDVPKFVISAHPSNQILAAGFAGSYAYKDAVDVGGREVPIKDKFSHPQDGHQYIACVLNPQEEAESRAEGVAVATDYAEQFGRQSQQGAEGGAGANRFTFLETDPAGAKEAGDAALARLLAGVGEPSSEQPAARVWQPWMLSLPAEDQVFDVAGMHGLKRSTG